MPHGQTTALLLGGGSSRSSISCGEARRGEHFSTWSIDFRGLFSMSRRPSRQQSPPPPLAVHLAVPPPRGTLGTPSLNTHSFKTGQRDARAAAGARG